MIRPLHRVRVSLPAVAGAYEVVIGPGVWSGLPTLITRHAPAHRYAVITDDRVGELYATRLLQALHAAGGPAERFVFPAGEAHKTRESWEALTDSMLEAGIGRDGAVVALGGGVVGDLAGFVAATYMRGLPLVQVPTTLLAMIDSSVGGKTGVDTPAGKNLVGAFHQPRVVVIDPEVLRTLPAAQLRAGLAEAVKHGAIADADYLRSIEEDAEALLAAEPEAMTRLIVRSVEIKAEFVARDEREAGPRKALNFGHTLGHAIEAASGFRLLHGEAVAIGMVLEAAVGERLGVTQPGTTERLRALLGRLGLPVAVPADLATEAILAATRTDKKARAGRVEYALVEAIGNFAVVEGRWAVPVPDDIVRECVGA